MPYLAISRVRTARVAKAMALTGRRLRSSRREDVEKGRAAGRRGPLRGLLSLFSRRLGPPPDVEGHKLELHRPVHGGVTADTKTATTMQTLVLRVGGLDPAAKAITVLELLGLFPPATGRSGALRRQPG